MSKPPNPNEKFQQTRTRKFRNKSNNTKPPRKNAPEKLTAAYKLQVKITIKNTNPENCHESDHKTRSLTPEKSQANQEIKQQIKTSAWLDDDREPRIESQV